MYPTEIPGIHPDEFSRCEERSQRADPGQDLSPGQKTDAAIKRFIDHVIWKNDVLKAKEYYEIEVHVKDGVVYLNGHISGATSSGRIETAIRGIPGILGIRNNLVLDDRLILDVARSLGELEHDYDCKFFTGASYGVISLNGNVRDENVKLLAEQRAASNPNVRGVINNVRVSGAGQEEVPDEPFLQPMIGEFIYFLDGVPAVVKQVIINPNNRRVKAMIIEGKFSDQPDKQNVLTDDNPRQPGQLIVLPMKEVRYLTKVSGFLYIHSKERDRFMDFSPTRFHRPEDGWKAPHPYCPGDVLFSLEKQEVKNQMFEQTPPVVALQEQTLWEQLLANENLGG